MYVQAHIYNVIMHAACIKFGSFITLYMKHIMIPHCSLNSALLLYIVWCDACIDSDAAAAYAYRDHAQLQLIGKHFESGKILSTQVIEHAQILFITIKKL